MHTIEIPEINFYRQIPENLGECNREEYLDMSKLVLMYQMAEINERQFLVLAFYRLLNMHYEVNELPDVQDEKMQNIVIASEILRSFFSIDENERMVLVQNYVHNPIKKIKYGIKRTYFYGPKDSFSDMTYGQLEDAIGELNSFLKNGEIESLVKIFAIFNLKKYEKYQDIEDKLDERVEYFKTLDIRYVYGFYLLFTSFWQWLITNGQIEFEGREYDLSVLFKRNASDDEADEEDLPTLGFRSTGFELAESGIFGSYKEMRAEKGWQILFRMYDLYVRGKKMEKEMEQQKEKSKQNAND